MPTEEFDFGFDGDFSIPRIKHIESSDDEGITIDIEYYARGMDLINKTQNLFLEGKYGELETECTKIIQEEKEEVGQKDKFFLIDFIVKRGQSRIMLNKNEEASNDLNFAFNFCEKGDDDYKKIQAYLNLIKGNYKLALNLFLAMDFDFIDDEKEYKIIQHFANYVYQKLSLEKNTENEKLTQKFIQYNKNNKQRQIQNENSKLKKIYFTERKFEKIIEMCNQYLESEDMELTYLPLYLNSRGEAYFDLEDFENAKVDFQMALNVCDEKHKCYNYIQANIFRTEQNYEKALKEYKKAIDIITEEEDYIYYYMGICFEKIGDFNNADFYFSLATGADVVDPKLLFDQIRN